MVLLLWIFYFYSVLCLLCLCARLFICALWSPAGKGLTSGLSFVVSAVSLSLSHWYPGSGVVLDCIDSWSLHPYLLWLSELFCLCCVAALKSLCALSFNALIFPILIASLNLSSWCLVMVERLFLVVPRGCLQFLIVVFPDHTHLLFLCVQSSSIIPVPGYPLCLVPHLRSLDDRFSYPVV